MRLFKALGFAVLVASGSMLAGASAFAQQDWPNRAVRVIVPFGAGGAADRLGRIAAEHLTKAFKQQFYVENRVGAGGAVASTQVARADTDGYTLLIGGSGPHIMGRRSGADQIHRGRVQALDRVRRGKGLEEIGAVIPGARAQRANPESTTAAEYGFRLSP
jgi:hypothetical protein